MNSFFTFFSRTDSSWTGSIRTDSSVKYPNYTQHQIAFRIWLILLGPRSNKWNNKWPEFTTVSVYAFINIACLHTQICLWISFMQMYTCGSFMKETEELIFHVDHLVQALCKTAYVNSGKVHNALRHHAWISLLKRPQVKYHLLRAYFTILRINLD